MENGWRDVRPMLGGFDAWRQAGYPTVPKADVTARQNRPPIDRAA